MTFENVSQLSDRLADAYDALIEETIGVDGLQEDLLDAQFTLQEATDKVLLQYAANPKDLGANDSIREANLRGLTSRQSEYVREVAQKLRDAKNLHEIARLKVEHLRAQIRVWEIAAGTLKGGTS